MTNRINYNLSKFIQFKKIRIPYDQSLETPDKLIVNYKDKSKNNHPIYQKFQSLLYPTLDLFNYFFVDGFIQKQVGKYIKKYYKKDKIFLEIGCGDFSISSYLPKQVCYNAIDISFTHYYIQKLLLKRPNSNLAIASVLDIPIKSGSIDFIVCSEVFYEVPSVNKAFKEISRILKPNGLLVVTNPNSFCYKYQKKGDHSLVKNKWKFNEFTKTLNKYGFELIDSKQSGFWLPLPKWLIPFSIQIPISLKSEEMNTNFFYVFRIKK